MEKNEAKKEEKHAVKKRGINKGITKVAKTMIQKKFNLDSISEITGLSIKELSKLNVN